MKKNERDTQRALGNMEEYRVDVEIPIKLTVKMQQIVEAVSEEDAIEQLKTIHDIISNEQLLQDVVDTAIKSSYKIRKKKFDDSTDRKYKAHLINRPSNISGGKTSTYS